MLVYYNPHVDDFMAEPLQFKLLRRRPLKKYGFLINQAKALNQVIYVLVDGTASGIVPSNIFMYLPQFLKNFISTIEFNGWKRINGLKEEVVRVSQDKDFGGDTLLAFSYKAATGDFEGRRELLRRFKVTLFHLSHYFVATKEKSDNLRTINNLILAGDSNISKNKYFQKYFGWYKEPFLVLPFAVSSRFKSNASWKERHSRIIATGTFHDLACEQPSHLYSDYVGATGLTTYHPIRKAIFDAKDTVKNSIDCKISQYRQYKKSFLMKFIEKFRVSQKDYFALDIVDLYNKYQYAVVGEELSGFPALGAFEAMACGCILFAESEYYSGLNLIPGNDYIEYNNGLNGLLLKINVNRPYFDSNFSESISKKIRAEFNEAAVYDSWLLKIDYINSSVENNEK